ncbi:MAG: hypothetical protein BHV90_03350 [Clostridiales bacterium 42_27]|nr:MAG: hypothetical protein BHV90_03350 [Clostridiales bacterium 42_27]
MSCLTVCLPLGFSGAARAFSMALLFFSERYLSIPAFSSRAVSLTAEMIRVTVLFSISSCMSFSSFRSHWE